MAADSCVRNENKMSNRTWSKRWLYDSTVEVPKTTRWRRRIEFSNPALEEEIVDVRGEFSSEVIEDFRNNTSPLKKQKLSDDCLQNEEKIKSQSSSNDGLQTSAGGHDTSSIMHEIGHEYFEMGDELVDCEGEYKHS